MAESMYFSAVATMAVRSARPDLRAKALGKLASVLRAEVPAPAVRAAFVHDGACVVWANDAMHRLLGGHARPLEGRAVLSMFAACRHASIAASVSIALRGPLRTYEGDSLLLRNDGRIAPVACVAVPLVYLGAPAIHVAMVDLSERARVS